MSIALGVDIGGSHITAGWVDLKKAVVLKETVKRKLIDSGANAETIIAGWCGLLEATINDKLHDNIKIGIAMPGPFDYTEGISLIKEQNKFNALYGLNLRMILAQQLSLPPANIRFVNDAEGYLEGEMSGGGARNFTCVLGLTLGTGLGSAMHRNRHTGDADLWQMPFKEGIAEDYFSTRWFVQRYCALAGKQEAGLKEILENGKPQDIQRLFAGFAQNLCDFLVPLCREHGFDAVILGGNISQSHHHFFPALKRLLGKQGIKADVLLGMLQEEAILIGAAGRWKESVSTKSPATPVEVNQR
ncbi:MAG TPA: ROK family protein [Flavisolibacter sp.]|nr:ROK family protein [Flavisolibacter sp.]